MKLFAAGVLSFSLALGAWAHATFTGYSGAPGRGTCAGSCHGTSGGTIAAQGFPAQYVPNQAYLVTVNKLSGSSIRNFNASARIGAGTDNAGAITAGQFTATYNVTGETNGVHMSTNNHDSATFTWTAPAAGTGTVRLYLAGLQGGSSGQNSVVVVTSDEAVDPAVEPSAPLPHETALGPAYPNPFNATVVIPFSVASAQNVEIAVYDVTGRKVADLVKDTVPAGAHSVQWNSSGIGSGIYFVTLRAGAKSFTSKIVALK